MVLKKEKKKSIITLDGKLMDKVFQRLFLKSAGFFGLYSLGKIPRSKWLILSTSVNRQST